MNEIENRELHDARLSGVKKGVEAVLKNVPKDGDPAPMCSAFEPGSERCSLALFAMPSGTPEEKGRLLEAIKMYVAIEMGDAAAYIVPTWMRMLDPESIDDVTRERVLQGKVRVSDDPKRFEAVSVMYMSHDGVGTMNGIIDRSGDHPVVSKWECHMTSDHNAILGLYPDALRAGLVVSETLRTLKDEIGKEKLELAARDLRSQFKIVFNEEE